MGESIGTPKYNDESEDWPSRATPSEEVNGMSSDANAEESDTRRLRRKRNLEPVPPANSEENAKNTKKTKKERNLDLSWICMECREAECMMNPDADQLLICGGPCHRVFHYPCVGLDSMPSTSEDYICKDCKQNQHACSFCQEYGADDEEVFKCSIETCGLFYHEACLSMRNVEFTVMSSAVVYSRPSPVTVVEGPSSPSVENEGDRCVFTCPAHRCWSCTQVRMKQQEAENMEENEAEKATTKRGKQRRRKKTVANSCFAAKNDNKLFRCLECPISYHITCIPLAANFHELAILCHEHAPNGKLPYLDMKDSLQQEVESKADKYFDALRGPLARKMKGGKMSRNLCFPFSGQDYTNVELAIKEALPASANEDSEMDADLLSTSFCLPCTVKDEVHSNPPIYKHVHSLQYDPKNKPPRVQTSIDVCNCIGECNESCYNRMVYTECFGDVTKSGSSNCSVGPNCGNRQISKRKFVKCKPQREQGKGWGLVTLEKVQAGQLVLEYVGEVIDSKTKEERLSEWAEEHPNDPNFYVMALSPGWFVDARKEANLSRFINHSCDPNCVTHPVNVKGFQHNAIVALRDIKPGEFLSYDYQFDTQHGDRFVCRCGAKNCRGTMKLQSCLEVDGHASKALTAAETWENAKTELDKDKKFVMEFYEEEEQRRCAVSESVPGSEGSQELVASGPQLRYRDSVRQHQIFLWRNAVRGANLFKRLPKR